MSIPKHYVIKNDRLEEVRGYKDEVVVERWGIVYNEDDIPIGLRPLPVEEVIPESILDRIKFWRKPKPLTQILSIDFIGLIQYIGLINKIKTIESIGEIKKIGEWAAGSITASIWSLLAGGSSDTIDSNSLDITFYSLEFATDYKDMILEIRPRLANENLSAPMQIAEKDGTGRVDYTPSNINTHKSNLFEELIYDEANNYYKVALKYALRFGNGFEIKVKNPDSVAHNYVFESLSLRKT